MTREGVRIWPAIGATEGVDEGGEGRSESLCNLYHLKDVSGINAMFAAGLTGLC